MPCPGFVEEVLVSQTQTWYANILIADLAHTWNPTFPQGLLPLWKSYKTMNLTALCKSAFHEQISVKQRGCESRAETKACMGPGMHRSAGGVGMKDSFICIVQHHSKSCLKVLYNVK